MTKTIKVDGRVYEVVNSYSAGPGTRVYRYLLRGESGNFEVSRTGNGWICNEGRGAWMPELSIFATRCVVEE